MDLLLDVLAIVLLVAFVVGQLYWVVKIVRYGLDNTGDL